MALIFSPILIGKKINEHFPHFTNATWLGAMLVLISLFIFCFYILIDYKQESSKVVLEEEKFHLKDFWTLFRNPSFIYITLLCVTFYSAVFPFLSYAPDLFVNKFHVNQVISGQIASILPFGTILFTPFFGWFVDRKGKSATLMIYGSIILILVHSVLTFTKLTPYLPIFCLGIAFSLVPAAMWPAVARIVEEKKLGTAYGIMTSIQNLGLFTFPILAGRILDITPKIINPQTKTANLNYTYTLLMFVILGLMGLVFAFLLKAEDRKRHTGIELPSTSAK